MNIYFYNEKVQLASNLLISNVCKFKSILMQREKKFKRE